MYNAKGQRAINPIEEYIGLVKKIAYQMKAKLPSNVCIDDMIQDGCMGLMDAWERYKDDQGAAFETYANQRIRGAILDKLRDSDVASRDIRREQRRVEEAIRVLEQTKGGEPPLEGEIAKQLGISIQEYHSILTDTFSCQQLYLEDMNGSHEENILDRMFPDSTMEPSRRFEIKRSYQDLVGAIEKLPEKEKMAMALLYDEDLNLKEAGITMGVTESRVCQLHSQAIARIQSFLNIEPAKKKKPKA